MLPAIQVAIPEDLRESVGADHVVVAAVTVRDALDDLETTYPKLRFWDDQGQPIGTYRFAVNGIDLSELGGVDTILRSGDTLTILSRTPAATETV